MGVQRQLRGADDGGKRVDREDDRTPAGQAAARDVEILADLAAALQEAAAEGEIYARFAGAVREVVGEDAIINVSDFDARTGVFAPRSITGLGAFLDKATALVGRRLEDLSGDYPPSVRRAMASGRLVRVEGGVVELAGDVIPPAICRTAAALLKLEDVYVVGFSRGSTSGGVCIITRRPRMAPRAPAIEAMARLAAVALARLRAQAALEETRRRFEQLAAQSGTVVWEVDREGLYTYVSEVAVAVIGFAPEEIVGRLHFYDLHPPEGRDAFRAAAFEAFARKEDFAGLENPVVTKDGRTIWVSTNGIPVLDAGGALLGYRGSDTDVTERRRLEDEKEKLRVQLLQAQKMESIGRLAGGVAHDFNNMLGAITGYAEFALEQVDPAGPVAADIYEIQKAAARSVDMTRQLLAFARRQTIAPKVLDLNETLGSALKMLRRLVGEDIDVIWMPGRGVPSIRMDLSQIDQVLANLCVNARDAIDGVGRITIETSGRIVGEADSARYPGLDPGEYACLTVSDDGCGMDAATLAKLFEPFFTTKAVGKGTGLGLATVHGIVEQNGGHIAVRSEPGRGTAFEVLLPRYSGASGAPAHATGSAAAPRGRGTVLVVEDEAAIRKVATRMLEKLGYSALAAASPSEAFLLARRHAGVIDLLLTDVIMPEMNGRELARNLLPLLPGIGCLYMSGYPAEVIASHGVLEDGVHFLRKPFSQQELAAKVGEALAARSRG